MEKLIRKDATNLNYVFQTEWIFRENVSIGRHESSILVRVSVHEGATVPQLLPRVMLLSKCTDAFN